MSERKRSRSFAPLELILIALALVTFTALLTRNHTLQQVSDEYVRWSQQEASTLRERYGPHHYSRSVEEWIIRDHFQDRRDGFFLDVGANHYRDHSNTYYLESRLGWSGIAVDALEEFAADYAKFRTRTRYFAFFVSDQPDSSATLFVPENNKLVASASHEFTVDHGEAGTARSVPTTTLNTLLEAQGVQRIDFLSMDIELAEPKALAGFDLARYRPSLVCIEDHAEVRQQILDYFDAGGYRLLGKYLRMDPNNLYFSPSS